MNVSRYENNGTRKGGMEEEGGGEHTWSLRQKEESSTPGPAMSVDEDSRRLGVPRDWWSRERPLRACAWWEEGPGRTRALGRRRREDACID